MEIKGFTNAISAYKLNSYENVNSNPKTKTTNIRNKDVVEFSSKPSNIQSLKASIATSVNESADSSKIAMLRQKINDGSYNVSAENILMSMMG